VFVAAGKVIADETAASVAQRARHHLRLVFDPGADAQRVLSPAVQAALSSAAAAQSIRTEKAPDGALRVSVQLHSDDPREYLADLHRLAEVPRPSAIVYGELSLSDLYREIYGVEGC
jgi:hypothetical protein